MPRTTADLVQQIVQVQANILLDPFIAFANQLTTDVCGPSNYPDTGVGSKMELIERWLAAHVYTVFDNQLSHAKAGTVAVGYQYKVDLGLQCSMYGQQAMLLDTDGNLAKLNNTVKTQRKITIGLTWLGRRHRNSWWPDLCYED